ncbi:hypothetical protein VB715_20495 [Crocosphaera sp. UHCC 0190]|uniref:hypothetical protein n=1 Tax=Crocosphaera sp. UHCC 0190 TaxID=3110246 RepID=UPI002B21A676|nr:hypothetical protein [Crocosphaera sp. UHCC 0190]MEA5512158.1 hypothetical protein [Crocosphaera sp. UHCC 0190]
MLRIVTHDRTKRFTMNHGKTVSWLLEQLTQSYSVNDPRLMPPQIADADESY